MLTMSRREINKLDKCPCGSNKSYKYCCKNKSFKFVQDMDTGQIYKRISLLNDNDIPQYIKELVGVSSRKELWSKAIGVDISRINGAEYIDVPYIKGHCPEELETIELMKQANIPKELIYAYQKTGLIVTENNKKFIPDIELEEFYDAANEYIRKYKKG